MSWILGKILFIAKIPSQLNFGLLSRYFAEQIRWVLCLDARSDLHTYWLWPLPFVTLLGKVFHVDVLSELVQHLSCHQALSDRAKWRRPGEEQTRNFLPCLLAIHITKEFNSVSFLWWLLEAHEKLAMIPHSLYLLPNAGWYCWWGRWWLPGPTSVPLTRYYDRCALSFSGFGLNV